MRCENKYLPAKPFPKLRVIGSVGEPINPEAWHWIYEKIGFKQCAIVDTYWQTETGSIVMAPIPGAIPTKAGSATLPFFGIDPKILEPTTAKVLEGWCFASSDRQEQTLMLHRRGSGGRPLSLPSMALDGTHDPMGP